MSSAADHYAAAESLLDIQPAAPDVRAVVLAEAQVHATLALAAAVAALRPATYTYPAGEPVYRLHRVKDVDPS
jgi:hypothetical protein